MGPDPGLSADLPSNMEKARGPGDDSHLLVLEAPPAGLPTTEVRIQLQRSR